MESSARFARRRIDRRIVDRHAPRGVDLGWRRISRLAARRVTRNRHGLWRCRDRSGRRRVGRCRCGRITGAGGFWSVCHSQRTARVARSSASSTREVLHPSRTVRPSWPGPHAFHSNSGSIKPASRGQPFFQASAEARYQPESLEQLGGFVVRSLVVTARDHHLHVVGEKNGWLPGGGMRGLTFLRAAQ